MRRFLVTLVPSALVLVVATACSTLGPHNPAASGFDERGSDARAIEIADLTMAAMGGREAWDRTRVLCWNFFGRRTHVWDKWTGDYRLDEKGTTVYMNLNARTGRVFEGGEEVTAPDRAQAALESAWQTWVNDSYWLVMPYKLKDSGVTLRHGGEAVLPDGRAADKLVLTFAGVGVTPENKYEVLVSKDRRLVESWSFFKRSADAASAVTTPWADWKRHGEVLLASSRGEKREISAIAVLEAPPERLKAP